ncbi:MAG: hypothetical protein H6708_09300 [Kofleriaceae bacterium]|nr:hypothetical protein [Kofleriaceae bacterium]
MRARTGRLTEARGLLGRGAEAARRAGDVALAIDALLELAACQLELGEAGPSLDTAERVAAASRQLGDAGRLARGELAAAAALLRARHLDAAQARLDALAGGDVPATVRAWSHRHRAWIHLRRGDLAAARDHAERGVAAAQAIGDPTLSCVTLAARAAQSRSPPASPRSPARSTRPRSRRRAAARCAGCRRSS